MLTTPYAYQLDGMRRIHRFDGICLVAWDPGLGKSLVSLGYGERKQKRPITVVCPASLKWNWERECEKHFGWRAAVLSGRRPAKRGPFHDFPVTVINYDILHDWLPVLQSYGSELLVIDESQKLAGRTTRRTKATRALARGVKHRLALSGTPMLNRPADLWATLNVLRPDLFGPFFPYALDFCAAKKMPWAWDFSGVSNPQKLNRVLAENLMIRLRKEDVLKDLPPVRAVVVPVELSDHKQYELAEKDFVLWLATHKPEKMTNALRAERLTRMGYLKRLAAALKMPNVYDWADVFLESSEEKIILFGIHREGVVDATHARYKDRAEVIHGGTVGVRRQENFDRFLNDRRKRILVGNIEAAGTGLSALGVPNVAFMELAWRPTDHDQAIARVHGVGRGVAGRRSVAYFFVAKGTIEEHVMDVLQYKQKAITAVIDGGEAGELEKMMDLLHRKLLGGKS